ncbi:MAG: amidohydrolase family protein, partial [Planctomycetota bacterium]
FYERLGTRLKRDEVRCLELAPAEQVASWDEECRMPDPRRPGYAKTVDTFIDELPRMHAAGIRLLISPGSGPYIVPGAGYAEEVALLARSGLSPRELLRAATSNAAASLGVEDITGRVAVGHRADLVLLDRDPLGDATAFEHVSGTVLAGRVVDHDALRSTIDRALGR